MINTNYLKALLVAFSLFVSVFANAQLSCAQLFLNDRSPVEFGAAKAIILNKNEDIASIRWHIIRSETKRIRATYYQIDGNKVGRIFFAELLEAAKRGVEVQLMTDAMSPVDWMDEVLSPAMYKALMDAGVQIRIFNAVDADSLLTYMKPANLMRSHDKLLIGESQAILTTGDHNMQNFEIAGARRGAKGLTYRGIEMAIQSQDMVAVANAYFEGMWDLATPPDISKAKQSEVDRLIRFFPKFRTAIAAKELYNIPWASKMVEIKTAQFLSEVPGRKGLEPGIGAQLVEMVNQASDSVVIYAPYLRVTPLFEKALDAALARNVKIRYVVPSWESIDTPWTMQVAQKQFADLRKRGIEIRQHQGKDFLHAKLAIIDDKKVFVGTYNFNDRSENTDYEIGFVVEGQEIVQQAKDFDQQIIKNESGQFKPAKLRWYQSLYINVLRLILAHVQVLSNQR